MIDSPAPVPVPEELPTDTVGTLELDDETPPDDRGLRSERARATPSAPTGTKKMRARGGMISTAPGVHRCRFDRSGSPPVSTEGIGNHLALRQ